MPAFAMEIVCCSIASWMATWSFTSILSNSSMQQIPLSASINAPASMANSLFSGSCARWCSVGTSKNIVSKRTTCNKQGSYQGHREHEGAPRHLTLTTEAVRPAADEALPEVYTARGRKLATYLRICDFAQDGSPTIATLMSPRRLMPCAYRRSDFSYIQMLEAYKYSHPYCYH